MPVYSSLYPIAAFRQIEDAMQMRTFEIVLADALEYSVGNRSEIKRADILAGRHAVPFSLRKL